MKLILWLDQINDTIAGFQGFTYTLFYLSQIVLFKLIFEFSIVGCRKSNLHTFDLQVLYLWYIGLWESKYIWTFCAMTSLSAFNKFATCNVIIESLALRQVQSRVSVWGSSQAKHLIIYSRNENNFWLNLMLFQIWDYSVTKYDIPFSHIRQWRWSIL